MRFSTKFNVLENRTDGAGGGLKRPKMFDVLVNSFKHPFGFLPEIGSTFSGLRNFTKASIEIIQSINSALNCLR